MSRPSFEDSLLETEKKHVFADEEEHALEEVVSVLPGACASPSSTFVLKIGCNFQQSEPSAGSLRKAGRYSLFTGP